MSSDFEWKDEYSVNVKEIDAQHKELITLIFKLFKSINKQETKDELSEILNELIKYAGYHFSTEEKYFKEFNYEYSDEHIAEHAEFVEKMLDLQKRHSNNDIAISFELIDFLEDWLLDHLMSADKKYIACFTKNGLK